MSQTNLIVLENLKVYTIDGYDFLIIEPIGNISYEQYKAVLSNSGINQILETTKIQKVYLELNGMWVIGTEQQDWTINEFQMMLSSAGVLKLAIGIAEHVYPTMKNVFDIYEINAAISTKYFDNLGAMSNWMKTY